MSERTLLSLAEEACHRAGLRVPATIISNNEKVARYLETAANDSIRQIRLAAANNNGWSGQQVATTITLASGVQYYDLPTDYEGLIPGAAFLADQFTFFGPTDPVTWRAVESGLWGAPTKYRWRVNHNKIRVQPTPTATDTVYIEYLTRAMVQSTAAAAWDVAIWDQDVWDSITIADRFLADSDQPRVPDWLVSLGMSWRLLRRFEQPYAEVQAEFEEQLEVAISRDGGGPPHSRTMGILDFMRGGGDVAFTLGDDGGVTFR